MLEHFRLRRWLRTGASRIGDDAVVWGAKIVNRSQLDEGAQVGGTQLKTSQDPLRDPFWVYAHKYTVFLPAAAGRTEQQRKVLAGLLAFGTPAHTAGSIEYVEPRFRIGVQSSLGLDSVVARVPSSGLVVDESLLGQATVLSRRPHGLRRAPPARYDLGAGLRRREGTMMTSTHLADFGPTPAKQPCGCGYGYGPFSRNNYWYGKLMLPQDFTDEQTYLRDKIRLHNQRLHGTGVVCGLIMQQDTVPGCQDRIVDITAGPRSTAAATRSSSPICSASTSPPCRRYRRST